MEYKALANANILAATIGDNKNQPIQYIVSTVSTGGFIATD